MPNVTVSQKSVLIFGAGGYFGSFLRESLSGEGMSIKTIGRKKEGYSFDVELQREKADYKLLLKIKQNLGSTLFDAVICAAGGYKSSKIEDQDVIESTRDLLESNVITSLVCANLAQNILKQDGLLILCGAEGATKPTPNKIGYGIAKQGVHQIVRSLSQKNKFKSLGLLITKLEDSKQRESNLFQIKQKVVEWIMESEKPKSGSFFTF